jgi:hypothetical protein
MPEEEPCAAIFNHQQPTASRSSEDDAQEDQSPYSKMLESSSPGPIEFGVRHHHQQSKALTIPPVPQQRQSSPALANPVAALIGPSRPAQIPLCSPSRPKLSTDRKARERSASEQMLIQRTASRGLDVACTCFSILHVLHMFAF